MILQIHIDWFWKIPPKNVMAMTALQLKGYPPYRTEPSTSTEEHWVDIPTTTDITDTVDEHNFDKTAKNLVVLQFSCCRKKREFGLVFNTISPPLRVLKNEEEGTPSLPSQ